MIKYLTEESTYENLEKYEWLKQNYQLLEIGEKDDREITRLLNNIHYSGIQKILSLIDQYGKDIPSIVNVILVCNDQLVLARSLSELYFYVYLKKECSVTFSPIPPSNDERKPDFKINSDELTVFVEIYSPMDFYSLQLFERYIPQIIKNLSINKGFTIDYNITGNGPYTPYNFPSYKEVQKWLKEFENTVEKEIINEEEELVISGPAETTITIKFKEINNERGERFVGGGNLARSTDTSLYFERDNIDFMKKTEWAKKIQSKMQKRQAGEKEVGKLRMLLINFYYTDTPDLSFLNEDRYFQNFRKLVTELSGAIENSHPYDLVLGAQLGFECGFTHPIILTDCNVKEIDQLIERICLNKPIPEISQATEEETKQVFDIINPL